MSAQERALRWAYAGHPTVLWLDSGEELSGGRTQPLGISEDFACSPGTHDLTPGTGVLLYTDGVTEARHDGEQFGPARLATALRALEREPTSRIVAALTSKVERFADDGLSDDLCVVAARVD
jgi:sigma-B regulation protein RsbU (phosphoserine phosphatase)